MPEDNNMGWQCPKCKKVFAPSVKSCADAKCKESMKAESNETDTRQLLLEA